RFKGLTAEGSIDGARILALKPQTYMNLSGESVGEAARFYKVPPEDVIVLYDEIELAAGKLKVKRGGGSAGHNGIRSIDAHLGPDDWRVRLGVGRPGAKHLVTRHVLNDFDDADEAWLKPLLAAVCDALPLLVTGDDNKFMTKVALLTRPPAPKKEQKP